jgi:hypothetical protein
LGSTENETEQKLGAAVMAIDGNNNLHVCGVSESYSSFPTDNGGGVPYFQPTRSGTQNSGDLGDATITRFDLATVNTFVGLNKLASSFSFGTYPNPTTKNLIINKPELLNQMLQYSIYSTTGQKLAEGSINTNDQTSIDVSALQPGIYIITVSTDVLTLSNKFIKTSN